MCDVYVSKVPKMKMKRGREDKGKKVDKVKKEKEKEKESARQIFRCSQEKRFLYHTQ